MKVKNGKINYVNKNSIKNDILNNNQIYFMKINKVNEKYLYMQILYKYKL